MSGFCVILRMVSQGNTVKVRDSTRCCKRSKATSAPHRGASCVSRRLASLKVIAPKEGEKTEMPEFPVRAESEDLNLPRSLAHCPELRLREMTGKCVTRQHPPLSLTDGELCTHPGFSLPQLRHVSRTQAMPQGLCEHGIFLLPLLIIQE